MLNKVILLKLQINGSLSKCNVHDEMSTELLILNIKDIVIRRNNTAEVKGIRKTFVSDKLVKQESVALRIAFRVKNGRFEVTGYEEVTKNGSA
jgi:hypothetical protein